MSLVLAKKDIYLADEAATLAVGKVFGDTLQHTGAVIYLQGTLGAGKTTLCKGIIAAYGYSGLVKSPTYTLVESYQIGDKQIYHFDLYRLGTAEELEFIGVRDYFQAENLCLIEWPEKGADYLSPADIIVELHVSESGRTLSFQESSQKGRDIMQTVEL